MPRRYQRPPVIEALCEFRFKAGQPWDWTIPGLMWDRIRNDFPTKQSKTLLGPEQPKLSEIPAALVPGVSELGQSVTRMAFLAEAGTPVVQVGPDLLSVNALRPYPGWETFLALTLRQLEVYRSVVQPEGLERVGLRYINRVDLPGAELNLGEFLRTGPAVPPGVRGTLTGFLSVADLAVEGSGLNLRFTLSSAKSDQPDGSSFIVDLDGSAAGLAAPPFQDVGAWLDQAHETMESAFDSTFADRAHREIFGEIVD